MSAPTLLQELDAETREHHAEADSGWLALMAPNVTRQPYVEQLSSVYGFESPLEGAFLYTPRLDQVIPLRERARSGLIAQDLLSLGLSPNQIAQLPQCYEIAPFSHAAEALGWMFVVERATLNHAMVKHHIKAQIPGAGCSYLSAYRGLAEDRWLDFGYVLERFAYSEELASQIIRSAHEAFHCQRRWLRGESQHAQRA
jgi:heme oxygenase